MMATRSRCFPRCRVARLSIDSPLDVRLLESGLSVGEASAAFAAAHREAGAVVSFTGSVRGEGNVRALEISHYEPLTLPGMKIIAAQALERFVLAGLLVWHRMGMMHPGDAIVLVAAASTHRRAAFDGAQYVMDHLKSAAWLWKREMAEGEWRWIQPRAQDREDLDRWLRP